jgi:hypothetical protein
MKTLTIRLREALVAQIEAKSRARRPSKSGIVRERLSAANGTPDAIADLIGAVDDPCDDQVPRKGAPRGGWLRPQAPGDLRPAGALSCQCQEVP